MNNFSTYLKAVEKDFQSGVATEHTYRHHLISLVESFGGGVSAINEPKRRTFGAPDYVVRKREIPLGYIEAKDVGKDLDKLDKREREQLKKYVESLNNIIYTNYLDFRWYVRGAVVENVALAEFDADGNLHVKADAEEKLSNLFEHFLKTQIETVSSAKELANRMASITKLIRRTIEKALDDKETKKDNALFEQFESFQKTLLPNLKPDEFADLYSQTIAYGLFTARCFDNKPPFTRREAAYLIPKTNPFLKQTFDRIGGINLDERIVWAVDDLAELLNRTDISAILQDFGKRTRREDPVVHFYETFLAEYDPKLRETRGVYYTPEPVVSYIVRSVDSVLQTHFGLPKGLADSSKVQSSKDQDQKLKTEDQLHKVLILDPATGTGTFLYSVIKHIAKRFENNKGMWDGYVSKHLLPRIFGFELLVAPYAVAHLKLGLLLEETGYKFDTDERLRVYLNNTLDFARLAETTNAFSSFINEEARKGREIQQDKPVMVVLGNPPYSGHSSNTGNWINDLLRGSDSFSEQPTENYFEVDGKPLGERNPKWLNDDYVKFIRFSQWRIDQTGYGVLAFVTNHGYLDNPTFRGMRQSLMKSFDEIYLLDLHGNAKKKEKSPDGSKDENVFDIQQGVSIGIFIKKKLTGAQASSLAVSADGEKEEVMKAVSDNKKRNRPLTLDEIDEIIKNNPTYPTKYDKQGNPLHEELELNEEDERILTEVWAEIAEERKQEKSKTEDQKPKTKIFHKHLYGVREVYEKNVNGENELIGGKYKYLAENDISTTVWTEIAPNKPFYLFIPQDETLRKEYDNYWKITDAMRTNVLGFQTHRDKFAIDFDKEVVEKRIQDLRETNLSDDEIYKKHNIKDNRDWQLSKARKEVREDKNWQNDLIEISYRPFDNRFGYFSTVAMDYPRRELIDHVANKENLCLGLGRQGIAVNEDVWHLISISKKPVDANIFRRGGINLFPLYLYPTEKKSLFDEEIQGRKPNFSDEFLEELFAKLQSNFKPEMLKELPPKHSSHPGSPDSAAVSPEEIFYYIYAVFHSPTYRARYAEFLKIDFPRVPLTSNYLLFFELAHLGEQLVELHLLESEIESGVTFPEKGSNKVEFSPKYKDEKVYINKNQYFENVPENAWNFHIGGYQVLHKWLKDRKTRELSFDDLEHYAKVVAALSNTIELMQNIDETIEENGNFPIE